VSEQVKEVVTSIVSNKLPKEFWQTTVGGDNAVLKDIHATVVERLQLESPDADTLELMMMERVCFLYIFMRAQEAQEVEFDRTYKDMMSLWVSMAADLRKTRLRAEEEQSIRMSIVSEVARAIKEAMKDVDPAISNAVQTKLVTLVAVS
jgi:hypothetical protein